MDECIHLLDPATCTICNGRQRREAREAHTAWSAPFRAKFDGFCRSCDVTIDQGDLIVYDGDEVRHAECVDR